MTQNTIAPQAQKITFVSKKGGSNASATTAKANVKDKVQDNVTQKASHSGKD